MQVPFITKAQVTWAYESIHLYRTKKYTTFKRCMEFPQFLKLSDREKDLKCKQYDALMLRFSEWLDELEATQTLTVSNDEVKIMLQILNYRPYHFVKPESIIMPQLLMLSGKYT